MDWLDHHSSHFSIHHQPSLGDSSEEVTNSHWYNKDSVANMARGVDSRVREVRIAEAGGPVSRWSMFYRH